jgi:phosphate transport system protein
MATVASRAESVYESALVSYLVSMGRTVEGAIQRAIEALLSSNDRLTSEIFMIEPRINEMEIVIDEHAVRMLRGVGRDRGSAPALPEEEIRLIVATLRINNDLERMGDLAVNIAQRVLALGQMKGTRPPAELPAMCAAVRAMVAKSLGALIHRNVALAHEVLESDDVVDQYRDRVFDGLLAEMSGTPACVPPSVQYVLASRYLERIADHATNIAEDIVYWVRGMDVRHGRALTSAAVAQPGAPGTLASGNSTAQPGVTEI